MAQPEFRLASKYARNHWNASRPSEVSARPRSQFWIRCARPCSRPASLTLVGSSDISLLPELADHPLERVEAAVDLVQPFLEPRAERRVFGLVGELPLLLRPRDEGRRDHRRDDREERDPFEHHDGADQAAADVLGRDVAVADGRDGLQRPPHLDPSEYPNIWVGMWWSLQTVTTV